MIVALGLAVTTWTSAAAAGSFLGDWFVIGTDAAPPLFGQLSPSIAFNPDRGEYLVVWHNERPVYPDIQAQRVDPSGELVGPPFYIAGGPGARRRFPDVVYNPAHQEYLVVWEELPDGGTSNIYSQRVGANGLLIGGATVLGSGPEVASCTAPAVAYASTSDLYMVVWQRLVQGSTSSDIEAQILSGTGTTVGWNFLVVSGTVTVHNEDPDIAYNRSRNEYLIVWTREDRNIWVKDIWGRIITRDGVLLGSEFFIGYHTSDDVHASVVGTPGAPNFGGYYVVWAMQYAAGDFDIYGRVVGWDGLLGSYDTISDEVDNETDPSIAYDEEQELFFVAWSRVTNIVLGTRDLVGLPYLPGAPQGGYESFVGGWSYPIQSAVAPGPNGDFLVAWEDAPYISDRDVYGRAWSFSTVFRDGFESGSCTAWSLEVP